MPRYLGKHQTGKTNKAKDRKIQALKPGKRKALKSGKRYYEYRRNRSDMGKFL